MAAKPRHKYLGVVVATKEKVTIEATSADAAKKEMKKLHGPEFTGEGITAVTNWVCGRQPGD